MENTIVPQELSLSLGSESSDFSVKAGRAQPMRKSLYTIFFGIVWTAFTSIFVFAFFGPLLRGKEVNFELNGVPTVASVDNLEPLLFPWIIIWIFVLIGLWMLLQGIYSLFKSGGYFVGTPTRLVCFQNNKLTSIDWEQFSGLIEVNGGDQKGDIALQMRTGRMVSRRNWPDRYVPDMIYISSIPNVFEIERICRKRIKENDPTPSRTLQNSDSNKLVEDLWNGIFPDWQISSIADIFKMASILKEKNSPSDDIEKNSDMK